MKNTKRGYIKTIIIVMVLIVSCCITGNTCKAEGKTGWEKGYYYKNGKKQTSTWVEDKYGTYYVDSSGKKITGWKKLKKHYYYFNEADGGKLRNTKKKTGIRLSKLSNNVLAMGIDMSEWQGNVNWKKIKASGVKFVMLRLGYGKGRYGAKSCTLDKRFRAYVEGANKVGLPIGIYFYSYATTPEQALAEAEFTIENLQGIEVSFPVAYDIEDAAIVEATDTATRTEMARTYMETIKAAGYTPMFYCNQNWYDNYLDLDKLAEYDFWYARYTYVEPDRMAYNYGMWQATSTQKLSGITENTVDLNFLYKDYFDLVEKRSFAYKYGWQEENGELYYYFQGKRHKSGWFFLAGNQYYLQKGAAATGWRTLDGERYYFDNNGVMQSGFTKIDGKIYLFNESGVLQLTTDEPGVTIREDGSCKIKAGWYENAKGKMFYRYSSGDIAKSTWIQKKGKRYYCDSKGYRVTGFKKIKGKKYYFASNGTMKTGWLSYEGKRYYFTSEGVMKTGWLTYKKKKYYFKKNGAMIKNDTVTINGKQCEFNNKGQLVKEW